MRGRVRGWNREDEGDPFGHIVEHGEKLAELGRVVHVAGPVQGDQAVAAGLEPCWRSSTSEFMALSRAARSVSIMTLPTRWMREGATPVACLVVRLRLVVAPLIAADQVDVAAPAGPARVGEARDAGQVKREDVALAGLVLDEVDVAVLEAVDVLVGRPVVDPEVDQAVDLRAVDHEDAQTGAGQVGYEVADRELVVVGVLHLDEAEVDRGQ